MRSLVLILAFLAIPAAVSAQTIRGVVLEHGTTNRIAGATVEVTDGRGVVTAATSDSLGVFVVFPHFPGRMTLRATHPSFTALRTDTVTAQKKETVTLLIHMTNSPIAIPPLVVTARSRSALNGFYERQRRNAFGRYIDEKEIERKRPVDFEHLLRGIPGVSVVRDGADGEGIAMHWSGIDVPEGLGAPRTTCWASIYVDGMLMPETRSVRGLSSVTGGGVDLDALVTFGQIAAVEIYRDENGVPFEFMNTANRCGSVAFWTRPIRDGSRMTLARLGIAAAGIGAFIVLEKIIAGAAR